MRRKVPLVHPSINNQRTNNQINSTGPVNPPPSNNFNPFANPNTNQTSQSTNANPFNNNPSGRPQFPKPENSNPFANPSQSQSNYPVNSNVNSGSNPFGI